MAATIIHIFLRKFEYHFVLLIFKPKRMSVRHQAAGERADFSPCGPV